MFEEVETGGSSEWKEFLTLLKKSRPRCPINGVFLVIPSDSLIKDTADEIEQKASKIARQFDLIQRTLDVRFPVFVVVTKSDLINGFREFFDNVEDPQLQHQIFGWSNPAPLDESYNPGFIDEHLKTIQGRLYRRRLALLQDVMSRSAEPGAEKIWEIDTLYAFPQSLAKIAPRMARYLELVFSVGSQWSCKPLFFRGIYFTSSMREGSALDEDLAESLGVPVDSLPDGRVWERDRAYFLRDLFIKKVFREKGLITHATNASKQHMRRKAAVLFSAAASVILLLFFTIYIAISFRRDISKMKDYLETSAKLIDLEKEEVNGLQVLEGEGEDSYIYIGKSGVPGVPEKGVTRFNFSAQLADSVNRWKIPLIFAPAAKLLQGIERESLNKAQRIVYEEGVLRPFLDATRDIMDTQEGGTWTQQEAETRALRQLIRIKAAKPLSDEGEYSAQTFLDPLFKYVFKHDPNQINRYRKDYREELHRPLDMIYTKRDWPPVPPKTDPNSQNLANAIKHGIKLFNECWNNPDPVGEEDRDGAQVQTMMKLKDAFDKFSSAETRILALRDVSGPTSDNHYTVEQLNGFTTGWGKSFGNLKTAKESIDNYVGTLKNPQSLETLWRELTKSVLQDVEENYEFLLSELKDVNDVENLFLSKMRRELENALEGIRRRLTESEFEQELKLFDGTFYAQVRGNRRLYDIRFEMYSEANEQLGVTKSISNVDEVAAVIEETEKTFTGASRNIGKLRNLDPGATLFQKASEISNFALDLAKRRQLYSIVKGGLEVAPESIEKLRSSVGEEAYDPTAAAAMLGGWWFLGDTLNKYDLPDETRLIKMFEDANGIYTGYTRKYLNHWLESFPEDWIKSNIPRENNWKAQHEQLQKLDVLDVFAELNRLGKSIEEDALDKVANFISDDDGKVKQFRDNMENLSNRFFQGKCERVLENWGELSDDAFKARNMLLRDKPIPLVRNYFFAASSPVEFVDMYWAELTQASLRILANEIQEEGQQAFNDLRKQYGGKFPLARDSAQDLTPADLITPADLKKARSLLLQALSLETYDRGTIGDGEKTEIDNVNVQLMRLREPPVPQSLETWVETIKQVFQGLPEDEEPYYCKITLLSKKEQEDDLLGLVREFRLVQGSDESVQRTGQAENVIVATLRYPGPPVRIEFYRYRRGRDVEPLKRFEFSRPWACLEMLHRHYQRRKGYIGLNIEDKGVFYLQLEFYKDIDCTHPVNFPRPDQWPSLKNTR